MNYGFFFRRYAPFESFGLGFEGDARESASTSLSATARTIGALQFSPGSVGDISGTSSGTSYAGLGAFVQRALGRHVSKVTSSVAVRTRSVECVRFTAQTAGANPMIPGAPEIDTYVDAEIVFTPKSLAISGAVRGDNFPNCEVFVTDASGRGALLFAFATDGGQDTGPMTRLAGDGAGQVLGTFYKRVPLRKGGAFA
ncbi:MAG TPA: hypothetical protein VMF52_00275 [Steroidobacteraceae bacterium]|nr:hypothetical protein [Steroidobacteraceae bacterium]